MGISAVVAVAIAGMGVLVAAVHGADTRTATAEGTVSPAVMEARIVDVLKVQGAALIAGDEAALLDTLDSQAPTFEQLQRRFRSILAPQPGGWEADPTARPTPVRGPAGSWDLPLQGQHCFGYRGCPLLPQLQSMQVATRWTQRNGRMLLADFRHTPEKARSLFGNYGDEGLPATIMGEQRTAVRLRCPHRRGHHPGLCGPVSAVVAGSRKAAPVADQYSISGTPPGRYIVLFAGAAEFDAWYGADNPEFEAGYLVDHKDSYDERTVAIHADKSTASTTSRSSCATNSPTSPPCRANGTPERTTPGGSSKGSPNTSATSAPRGPTSPPATTTPAGWWHTCALSRA